MKIKCMTVFLVCIVLALFSFGCGKPAAPAKPATFTFKHHTKADGLPEESITSLASFGGKIWAGSRKGFFSYDSVNWQIFRRENTNVLGSNIIEDIKVHNNTLWIATDNGACKYNGKNWSSVYTSGRARSTIGRSSEVAVATAYGVVISRGGQHQIMGKEGASLVMNEVMQVMYDSKGRLWAGTRAGIGRLGGSMFQNYTGPAKSIMGPSLIDIPASPANCQLPGNNIKVLMPFGENMAVGTTNGLCITDLDSNYTVYFAEHKDWFQRGSKIIEEVVEANCPLPGNIINALAHTPSFEMLFIGTDKGLGILHGEKWLDIKTLIPRLPSVAYTGLAYHNNDLWLASKKGIYQIKSISDLINKPQEKQPEVG